VKLDKIKKLLDKGFNLLEAIIENTTANGWSEVIETPFFGSVSKARLFAHIFIV
jgi:hypothetical protein